MCQTLSRLCFGTKKKKNLLMVVEKIEKFFEILVKIFFKFFEIILVVVEKIKKMRKSI